MASRGVTGLATVVLAGLLSLSAPVKATTPVYVDFYMESLCPFCVNFTETVLKNIMNNGIASIMKLTVIPYGNAHYDRDTGALRCQHGELECEFNELLNCALDQYKSQDKYFPFFQCVEKSDRDRDADVLKLGKKCAEHADMDWPRMKECKTSGQGAKLHAQAGVRTDALFPPHQYVPWVVVNGIPLEEGDELLFKYVCAAYTGDKRPPACFALAPPDDARLREVSRRAPVLELSSREGATSRRNVAGAMDA